MNLRARRGEADESILERYQRIRKIVEEDEDYKKTLIGPDIISDAHPRFWELSTMFALQVSPTEWDHLSVRKRGELIAWHKLDSMTKFIERHVEEMDRRRKEQAKKNMTTGEKSGFLSRFSRNT